MKRRVPRFQWEEEDAVLSRQSKWFWRREEENAQRGFYTHMFLEDMTLSLFPMSDREPHGRDWVTTAPQRPEVRATVAHGFAYGTADRGGYQDLARVVSEWGRFCAYAMLEDGSAWYEVAAIVKGKDRVPVGFGVLPIRAPDLVLKHGEFFQRVPTHLGAAAEEYEEAASSKATSLIKIDRERLVEIRLPSSWGVGGSIRRALLRVDRDRIPDFAIPEPGQSDAERVPFEFSYFNRTSLVAMSRAASRSGWTGRGMTREWQSGYYGVWKFIQMQRFKVGLRQAIAGGVGHIMAKASKLMGEAWQIRLQGLPTIEQVEVAEKSLLEGSVPASEILAGFRVF